MKVRTLGYSNLGAEEWLTNWMEDRATMLMDLRLSPRSTLPQWRGTTLAGRYGDRYGWMGRTLGNVNHRRTSAPIELADEREGIAVLRDLLEEGKTLVLLCGCRNYARCHRRTVVEALRRVVPAVEVEPEPEPLAGVKCLSLWQPYASWVVQAEHFRAAGVLPKQIENRTWATGYRGPLAIHAGHTCDHGAQVYWANRIPGLRTVVAEVPGDDIRGAVIGVVDLVDIVRGSQDPWALPGQYGWVLANARAVPPVPCAGRQGLYEVPARWVQTPEPVSS